MKKILLCFFPFLSTYEKNMIDLKKHISVLEQENKYLKNRIIAHDNRLEFLDDKVVSLDSLVTDLIFEIK